MDFKDIATVAGFIALIGSGGVGYGVMQARVAEQAKQLESLEADMGRGRQVLHQRISRAEDEVNARLKDHDKALADLNEAALRRVTDVETRIVQLTARIERLTEVIGDLRR